MLSEIWARPHWSRANDWLAAIIPTTTQIGDRSKYRLARLFSKAADHLILSYRAEMRWTDLATVELERSIFGYSVSKKWNAK